MNNLEEISWICRLLTDAVIQRVIEAEKEVTFEDIEKIFLKTAYWLLMGKNVIVDKRTCSFFMVSRVIGELKNDRRVKLNIPSELREDIDSYLSKVAFEKIKGGWTDEERELCWLLVDEIIGRFERNGVKEVTAQRIRDEIKDVAPWLFESNNPTVDAGECVFYVLDQVVSKLNDHKSRVHFNLPDFWQFAVGVLCGATKEKPVYHADIIKKVKSIHPELFYKDRYVDGVFSFVDRVVTHMCKSDLVVAGSNGYYYCGLAGR